MKKYLQFVVLIIVTLGFSVSLQSVLAAWTAPTAAPTGGNVSAPINTGSANQTMLGGLGVGGAFSVTGNSSFTGNVGIGTTSPAQKLDVNGNISAWGSYYYGDGKIMFQYTDTWLRLNPSNAFSSGIYAGTGISRTDGTLQVGASGGTLNVVSGGDLAYRTNVLFANTAGNVGIGTASPGAKLDVVGLIRNSAPSQGTIELSGLLPGYADNTYPTLKTSGSTLYFSVGGGYTGYLQAAGTYFKGYYDYDNPAYYADPNGSTRLNTLTPNIIALTTGDSPNSAYNHYGIYEEPGTWVNPYPDLIVEYHTGIKYVGYHGYGGHRFYTGYGSDATPTGLLLQIGDASNYIQAYNWIGLPNGTGLYSGVNSAHIYPNDSTYGAWKILGTRNSYGGINYNGRTTLMMQDDLIGLYNEYYGRWIMYGYGSSGNTYIGGGGTATINGYVRGATMGFGGMYSNSGCYGCRSANPFTGACSCPAGFTAQWLQQFPEANCGWYTGNTYVCYK